MIAVNVIVKACNDDYKCEDGRPCNYGCGKACTCADVDMRTCNDAIMREESDTCEDMNLNLTLVKI